MTHNSLCQSNYLGIEDFQIFSYRLPAIGSALIFSFACMQFACAAPNEKEDVVHNFLELLVSDKPPLLIEYNQFHAESTETFELEFEINKCKSFGWEIKSDDCISFIRNRKRNQNTEISLYIDWIRNKFSTAGKAFKVVKINPSSEGFEHAIVKATIGNDQFELFLNTSKEQYTGLHVDISSINSVPVNKYFPLKAVELDQEGNGVETVSPPKFNKRQAQ